MYLLNDDVSNDTAHNVCTSLDSLQSRLEVVDRDTIRRKFARYSRQHAHVDDLSGINRYNSVLLQSSMLLQEDGALAARLDDVIYLLDGLLGHVKTRKGHLAPTCSVLELIQLLQDPRILQAVELSCQRRQIQSKMKELLLTKLIQSTEAGDEMFRISLAVLVYILSRSSNADEYFDYNVLDAVVCAIKQEVTRDETKGTQEQAENVVETKPASVTESTQQSRLLGKKRLKRKQSSWQQTLKPKNTVDVFSRAEKVSLVGPTLVKVHILDESCWAKLDEQLRDHESFYVEDKLHVSVISALSAALHILLQVGGCSLSFSSNRAQQYQREVNAQLDGAVKDAAEDAFQLIRARKCQLVRNGAIDVLVCSLAQLLNGVEALLPSTSVREITLECAYLFNSVSMLLGVFDQVTYLALDVQRYISKRKDLFALLLKLIQLLSELSWGMHARKRWEIEFTRMSLAVEVLLAALRVLTNLTHHNLKAASHVFALGGMQLLPSSFFQLRSLVATAKKPPMSSSVTSKWEFDACLLLLSVMLNSIEFSEENRDALASASICQVESVCDAFDLFTRFFLAKLQSYKHLIDLTETQGASGAILMEDKGDDWNPEDVILGGLRVNAARIFDEGLPGQFVFAAFHSQIDALTPDVAQSILHVEDVLKSCEGNGFETYKRCLTPGVDAKAYPGVFAWQYDFSMSSDSILAARSEEAGINFNSVLTEKFVQCESSGILPSSLQVRTLKNVCFDLDDSDEDHEPQGQIRDNVLATKAARASSQNLQAIEILVPAHTLPRTPCRKQAQLEFSVEASPALQTRTMSPSHASRSTPTAVRPDGSLSSPVVARLLKRTRELVEEFDVEFATLNCSIRETKVENNTTKRVDSARSPDMTLTMTVSCDDCGSERLDLSQNVRAENCNVIETTNKIAEELDDRVGMSFKRKTKSARNSDGMAKSSIGHESSSFEYTPAEALSSTPLRTQQSKALLRTPTRDRCSPGFYRSSPSLNLTPTKTTPSTPLWLRKSAGLLQASMKSDHSYKPSQSRLLVSPRHRKARKARVPASARSSSIFDFTA
ncbi:unnamed protein product [Peronospora belbahrii]|uniref:Wings apart-like protein C-terminal domain-containing protein n=1 Tax=Peronospora belbahrii TaxID=622444 RepID=A0AAU9KHY4_9STRA|nr:unnamed protein product [Peronospora belbahrii]